MANAWRVRSQARSTRHALPSRSILAFSRKPNSVAVRRDGRHRRYRLDPKPLKDVAVWITEFETFFNQRLDALGEYLARKHGARRSEEIGLAAVEPEIVQ
jgi:hypothetical protein